MIGRDCTALCRKAAMTRPYLRACTHMEASGRDTAYGVASRDNDSLEILPIYEWKSLCSIRTSRDYSTSSSSFTVSYRFAREVALKGRQKFFFHVTRDHNRGNVRKFVFKVRLFFFLFITRNPLGFTMETTNSRSQRCNLLKIRRRSQERSLALGKGFKVTFKVSR